ncbi:MAG TPA: hypothetical protein DCZ94_10255 [Lentisphaeria bacterium]|nr:MAG: hypothetical protein A2X48_11130 [Lentisphaerae bacterium GWF2_49_21]HBC87326.1 hypothetical protein [Lentisphaeria bacterium]
MDNKKKILFFICGSCIFHVFLLFALLAFLFIDSFFDHYTLEGPTSPTGLKVKIHVRDAVSWSWSADFNADVEIYKNGNRIFKWDDKEGRGYQDALDKFVKTMKWTNDNTLVFEDYGGKWISITLPEKGEVKQETELMIKKLNRYLSLQNNPSRSTCYYTGSNDSYHYFKTKWRDHCNEFHFKIKKQELVINDEIPLNQAELGIIQTNNTESGKHKLLFTNDGINYFTPVK